MDDVLPDTFVSIEEYAEPSVRIVGAKESRPAEPEHGLLIG